MTPMYHAILQLFANLAERLAARKLPEHSVHAYVFGGCAVHMHTQSRASSDVDVEFDYDGMVKASEVRLVLEQLPPVDYDDPATGPSQLIWDANFNTTFGPLHEGYQDRAQVIERGRPVLRSSCGFQVPKTLPCRNLVALRMSTKMTFSSYCRCPIQAGNCSNRWHGKSVATMSAHHLTLKSPIFRNALRNAGRSRDRP